MDRIIITSGLLRAIQDKGIQTDGPIDGSGLPIDVLVVTKEGKKWIRE